MCVCVCVCAVLIYLNVSFSNCGYQRFSILYEIIKKKKLSRIKGDLLLYM